MAQRPWALVVISFAILFLARGIQVAFAVFLTHMSNDLACPISSLAFAATIFMLSNGLSFIAIGKLADRHGPKKVLSIGMGLVGASASLMAFVQSAWQVYVLYGLIIGLTSMGCGLVATTSLISQWFTERRGPAFTFFQSAVPLSWLCTAPLAQLLMQSFGWRNAWLTLGITIVFITSATSLFLKKLGGSLVRLSSHSGDEPYPLKKALKVGFFLVIGLMVQFICGFTDIPFQTLWIPISMELGVDSATASYALGLMGATAFLGTVAIGLLSEKAGHGLLLAFCYALRALSISTILLSTRSSAAYYAFLSLLGFSFFSVVPVLSTWFSEVFGKRSIGTLFGFSQFIHFAGSSLGIAVFSATADLHKTYLPVFSLCLVLVLLNVPLCLLPFKNKASKT
ncbi:MAG: MFS transporter [Candidatus Nezhaarchaeota archaeon]|nr:MFS transporter [Candidatus Nezhaarchaeota archaeon]